MTAGNFTGNGRSDDLVVRCSDGETTMYKDTRLSELGSEVMLVASPNWQPAATPLRTYPDHSRP
ncbi:hypothetical protein [Streptomyces chrestomyceticus]|uniref:Uncharacterized protein n=1 Tax=Streptomyces chrestomyceticus TaxID=68185 RepID=A0ABU7WQH9_9ACTN